MTIYARPVGVHSYTLKRYLYQPKNKKIYNPTQDSSFVSVHSSSHFPSSSPTNFLPSHALPYLSEKSRDPIESSHSSSSLDTRRFYLIRRPDARATGQCGRAEYFRHSPALREGTSWYLEDEATEAQNNHHKNDEAMILSFLKTMSTYAKTNFLTRLSPIKTESISLNHLILLYPHFNPQVSSNPKRPRIRGLHE